MVQYILESCTQGIHIMRYRCRASADCVVTERMIMPHRGLSKLVANEMQDSCIAQQDNYCS